MNSSGNDKTGREEEKNAEGMDADGLRAFFSGELNNIYWAELMLVKVLPKMAEEADNMLLKQAIKHHSTETTEHVHRLDRIFSLLNSKPDARKCEAMSGILKDAGILIDEAKEQTIRDIGIISSWQKIEQYEMASYSALLSLASIFDIEEINSLLRETLSEEKRTADLLKQLMEVHVKSKNRFRDSFSDF
jgi:ferritin-like metal-binding protein YciE